MAWTRVQGFGCSHEDGAGVTSIDSDDPTLGGSAFSSAVAIGDVLVLATQANGDTSALSSTVTDQLGNTYTRVGAADGGVLLYAGGSQGGDLWWCVVTVAGTPVVTYTIGASLGWVAMKGSHYTGGSAGSTRRASAGAVRTNPGGTANAITSGAVASQSGDLVVGFCTEVSAGSTSQVAGTGFTGTTVSNLQMLDEWREATGAHAATFTDSANSIYHVFGIAITTAAISGGNEVNPTGVSMTMSIGTPTVTTTGNATVTPTGVAMAMSIGSPSISTAGNVTVTPTGVAMTMSIGEFTVEKSTTHGPSGLGMSMSVGTPTIVTTSNGDNTVTPTGLSMAFSIGTPTITTQQNVSITPAGISMTMSVGEVRAGDVPAEVDTPRRRRWFPAFWLSRRH